MERFGFDQDPPLDCPDEQMLASGVRDDKGQLLGGDAGFDIGRVAIGQGATRAQIQVTPLQMALVAGGGRQRRRADAAAPDRAHGRQGRPRQGARSSPTSRARVMKRETADQLDGDDGATW